MGQDLLLHGAVMPDLAGVEEAKLFRRAAPRTTAGTGGVDEDEVGGCGDSRGRRGCGLAGCGEVAGEIGDEGGVFFDAGGMEAAFQVMENRLTDIGDGEGHVGEKIVGEDGFSAAGGAGVPEECGRGGRGGGGVGWSAGEKRGEALGAIVLNDDFVVGGEMIFDVEAVGEAEGERGDEFIRGGGGLV